MSVNRLRRSSSNSRLRSRVAKHGPACSPRPSSSTTRSKRAYCRSRYFRKSPEAAAFSSPTRVVLRATVGCRTKRTGAPIPGARRARALHPELELAHHLPFPDIGLPVDQRPQVGQLIEDHLLKALIGQVGLVLLARVHVEEVVVEALADEVIVRIAGTRIEAPGLEDVGASAHHQDHVRLEVHQARGDQGDHLVEAGRDRAEIVDPRAGAMGSLKRRLHAAGHGIGEGLALDHRAVADDEDA